MARQRYDHDDYAPTYRQMDNNFVDLGIRSHYCQVIWELSRSFGRGIDALDLGCGTGRYFHCLEGIGRVTGIDASARMLEQARDPVRKELMKVEQIELICANFLDVELSRESFDFIYSIGVLGEYSPFDADICRKLYGWLKPGGKLFFTVVDVASRPVPKSLKRRIAERLEPVLLPAWKRRLWRARGSFYMTGNRLRAIMEQSCFTAHTISRHVSGPADQWRGAHFDCLAIK